MGRATQKDVAAVMGVSVMTVSNAFNRPDQLSEELRVRVLARAKKMGYSGPDAVARQLRTGRTNTYAVVFEEDLSYAFSDPFTVLWLRGFSEVMAAHGASITLLSVSASDPASLAAVQPDIKSNAGIFLPEDSTIRLFSTKPIRQATDRARTRVWTRLKTGK